MTRRRVLCGLLLASTVLTCFAGWLWMASGPRVTGARFEQVKKGMTRQEVIRTVGGPPGNYTTSDRFFGTAQDLWVADGAELRVKFDDAGTATEVLVFSGHIYYGPVVLQPLTFTERIRRCLGW
jgi:hypothetical protein